ncbi:MAG: hypothetical protein IKM08_05075 [Clostridia bacterium]|nr:hypothetical protein [Clostridia bacterium]
MRVFLPLASFFDIAPREYANFTFDEAARTTVRNIILAFCIGVILATLYTLYQKQVPGAIVRAILRAEAFTPDSAKSAEELGLVKNPFFRYELRRNMTLKRLIKTVRPEDVKKKDEKEAAPQESDTATEPVLRYYIPEELKYRAEIRYESKGNGLFGLIFTVVVTAGLGILLIKLLPVILILFDNVMN